MKKQDTDKTPMGQKRRTFRTLCQKKGFTKSTLAREMGVNPTHAQRLLDREWQRYAAIDLQRMSRLFKMSVDELIAYFENSNRDQFHLSSVTKANFEFKHGAARFYSEIPKTKDRFIGRLKLPPKKTIKKEQAPRSEFIFYEVLQGELRIEYLSEILFLQKGEYISFDYPSFYEVHNSSQGLDLIMKIFSYPSFL